MPTARFQRVAQLWNWLPSFRGVAEHESIHRAAAALSVSPSALSRTVKLLEDALSTPLFLRQPDGLHLTAFGGELLAATRDAMRLVDDCIDRHDVASETHTGPFTIGTTLEVIAAVVARSTPPPTTARRLCVRGTHDATLAEELLHGRLDLALTTVEVDEGALAYERVGTIRFGLYATPAHPLAGRAGHLRDQDLASQELVAPGFAVDTPGVVVATADAPGVLRTLCEVSPVVAILPDPFAARETGLVRLGDSPCVIDVYAASRLPVARSSRPASQVRDFVESLRRALA